ncbi:MAG: hypothetical protein ACXVAF_14670 [Vulcanimicrobiaceae bacterium]
MISAGGRPSFVGLRALQRELVFATNVVAEAFNEWYDTQQIPRGGGLPFASSSE